MKNRGSQPQHYELSGKVPVLGLLMAVAAAMCASATLGWFYAEFICEIPFIYVNFVATMTVGYLIGAAVSHTARFGKVRNQAVVTALALFGAGIGLYVAWAHDIAVRGLAEDPFFTLV